LDKAIISEHMRIHVFDDMCNKILQTGALSLVAIFGPRTQEYDWHDIADSTTQF